MAARAIYEFGGFRLDCGRRRVETKDGQAVALSAKAFDALVHLVQRAGEPVPRKALTAALWPGRIVEENNLTQAISALRRALGDGYVATLAGRGYQFVAEVRVVQTDAQGVPTAPSILAPVRGATAPVAVSSVLSESSSAPTSAGAHRLAAMGGGFAAIAVLALSAYLWRPEMAEHELRAAADSKPTVKVLVLPFTSLSSDPAQEAFSDGLTDELIIRLQQLSGVRVTGRTTSFALRDAARQIPALAAELDVQYVLEGSVGRDGERLRIRGHLSDASGFSVWAQSYERPMSGIFEIQDEIVSVIGAQLRATLGLDRALQRASTKSTEAYRLYLQARAETAGASGAPESLARPFVLIEHALELDPQFATAWMLKSMMHGVAYTSVIEGQAAALADAEDAALRAIELAPDQGDGYNARAFVLGVRGEWHAAERDYRRAQDLGFTDVTPRVVLLLSAGHFEKARETITQLLESDPLNPNLFAFLMLTHELLGETTAADAVYDRGRVLFDAWPFGTTARSWIVLGRRQRGPTTEEPIVLDPRFVQFAKLLDDRERALAQLIDAADDERYQTLNAFGMLAIWSAYFGDSRAALDLLEKAITGSALLTYFAWLPVFDDIREMPEFEELVLKVGLVDYWRTTDWPDFCRAAGQPNAHCG